MEDPNCFLKSLGLESYMTSEKAFCDSLESRVDMGSLDCLSLPYSKIKIDEDNEKTMDTLKDEGEKQDSTNEEVSQITANVQADDFFSSLELQSSSKTTSNMVNLNYTNKISTGIVTRSRSFSATALENAKSFKKINISSKTKKKTAKRGIKKGFKKESQEKPRRLKSKYRINKVQEGKKINLDEKEKAVVSYEGKKEGVKSEDLVKEKNIGLEKNKDAYDLMLFQNLGLKKESEEKFFENKQILGSDLSIVNKRCTPELFSTSPILMNDPISGKDDVYELLEEDYDDSFLEEMDEFSNAPPRFHTGGKWKPGSLSIRTSPMLWQNQNWENLLDERSPFEDGKSTESPSTSSTGGKWKSFSPPVTHTGGKWKPLSPLAEIPQKTKKLDSERFSSYDDDHSWKSESENRSGPPIGHTGGKWKPSSGFSQCGDHSSDFSSKSKAFVPPPDNTRGKWVSGGGKKPFNTSTLDVLANSQSTSGKCLKTSGGLIQYYCSPCSRRLSSKKMYKKHIQSELHFKRVLQENELEYDSRSLKLFRGLFSQTGSRERDCGKRVVKKPSIYKDGETVISKKGKKSGVLVKIKGKRLLKRKIIRCEVCKIKIPSYQLGKHLVSYYHSQRIRLNELEQQKLILNNIHAIVKQAPFQCGVCKFYCNTHSSFKRHWTLPIHKEMEDSHSRRFWCSLCSYECETSRSMELHLDSNSHREVIQAVNKSIPIIIRHKILFSCSACCREFRFNKELIRHQQIFHGFESNDTASKFECSSCGGKYKSLKSMQRHIINAHKGFVKVPYFCSTCNMSFTNSDEAKNHRNSLTHKYKKSVLEKGVPNSKGLTRKCSFCFKTLENIEELKRHLFNEHTSFLPKCTKCGKVFALSQEVSRHVKNNDCDFTITETNTPMKFSCEACPYTTSSKSEFLLHATVHKKKEEDGKKLECPLCGAMFTQSGLRVHLKTHLKEKTFSCSLCPKAFVRKDRYTAHMKWEHFVTKTEDLEGESDLSLNLKEEKEGGTTKKDEKNDKAKKPVVKPSLEKK